ncbi:MAG TPA: alpha/beta hydrolase [Cyclobacteriaceae bacterium]|nr:alpha/beta hydrolase [Cyclobacteriaceae bacterium]
MLTWAQPKREQTSGFNQIVDISAYEGGRFKLTAYARVEETNINMSIARLFVSVSVPNQYGHQENQQVAQGPWKAYTIEGPIAGHADKLVFGAYYYGIGKYHFDKFELSAKRQNGDWEKVKVVNPSFEQKGGVGDGWHFSGGDGFLHTVTSEDPKDGDLSLVIDGSPRTLSGKYAEVNGIRICHEFHGQGKDTILMLHGNGQSIQDLRNQIPVLAREFTVLAMDSRAQGYTSDDGRGITYDLMADDVNSLLELLKINRVNTMGWSDGGNTGLIMAMKHPDKVKSLAVMGANLYCDDTSVDDKLIEQLRISRKKLDDAHTPETDYQLRMIRMLLTEPNIKPEDLKSITCPVLVMAGSNDIIKKKHTRLIARKIGGSSLVIFKEGTHFEPQENPERFNAVLLDFLRRSN